MWCAWIRLNLYGCHAVLEIAISDLETAFLRKHLQKQVLKESVDQLKIFLARAEWSVPSIPVAVLGLCRKTGLGWYKCCCENWLWLVSALT